MLSVDELTQERWRKEVAGEAARDRRQRALAENLRNHSVTVEDDAGRDVSTLQAQIGKPMSADTLIQKLKKCNNKLVFIRHPLYEMYGVYLQDIRGKVLKFNHHRNFRGKHVCGMEAGIMPEFSVLHKTKIKVPNQDLLGRKDATREVPWKEIDTFVGETRGWRTVLVRLLHDHLITEADVTEHFGWTPTRESRKWSEATR